MDANRPSKKQRELLSFIEGFLHSHGYGPSYREVMHALDYKSVSTVATHINNLIQKGHLIKRDGSARSLEIVGDSKTQPSSSEISPAQEKWLIGLITERFQKAENNKNLNKKELDNLFVLVGALHVLGFKAAANALKPRLTALQQQIDESQN